MKVSIPRLCYIIDCSSENRYYCIVDGEIYSYDQMMAAIDNGNLKEDFIEIPSVNHSEIIQNFLKSHNVYSYRMKEISYMSDTELSTACHWYCEDNKLIKQWNEYKNHELSLIAISWCKENDISYTMKNYSNDF